MAKAWTLGMFGSLKRKVSRFAVGKFLALAVKAIAEGKCGKVPASIYWKLAGWKTPIALGLGILSASLKFLENQGACTECALYSEQLFAFAALLATIGLYDSAIRLEPPKQK